MRKIILYIASSLDSYIARPDGSVDWLFTEGEYGYQAFYSSVDVLLMGRKTYEQSLELSGGANPFADKQSYIFTRSAPPAAPPNIAFITSDIANFARNLKEAPGQNIWLVGGGEINGLFLQHDLIDELILSIHPIILGDGIPLFPRGPKTIPLVFVEATSYESGLVQLTYKRK